MPSCVAVGLVRREFDGAVEMQDGMCAYDLTVQEEIVPGSCIARRVAAAHPPMDSHVHTHESLPRRAQRRSAMQGRWLG
jgi:hypothetical protein